MIKGDGLVLVLLVLVSLFSIVMIFNQSMKTTGFATTGTTVSNVTISKYLSITMSTNLSKGIFFGTINSLPAVNVNASGNNNSLSTGANSTFFINVSTDSNTNVDFCLKAISNLIDSAGGNMLNVANESYSNSTTTNETLPAVGKEVIFTTLGVKAGINITAGNVTYYRFYLDIPTGTPSGTYNNTISFEGVEVEGACT